LRFTTRLGVADVVATERGVFKLHFVDTINGERQMP
jgi:hypothetical protein